MIDQKLCIIKWNGNGITNNEMVWIWKEAVMAYSKVPSQHLPGDIKILNQDSQ
jgi:hypothetical protein